MGDDENIFKVEIEPCPDQYTFVKNIKQYIGTTVTIFTESEGMEGAAVTGILLECSDSIVRVLTDIGCPPPQVNRTCENRFCPFYKICLKRRRDKNSCTVLGSIAEIPIESISTFFHINL